MARTKTNAMKSKKGRKGNKNMGKSRKTAPSRGGVSERKKTRWRPGTVALRDIKRY